MLDESAEITRNLTREKGEVPQFFTQGVTKMVANRLPNYISQQDKDLVVATHPDPHIYFKTKIEHDEKTLKIPDFVKQQDKLSFCIGIGILNEMATESLVLKTLGEKRSIEIVASKFPALANKFMDIFASAVDTNETTQILVQHLHVAYMTGKRAELDSYLKDNYGFSGLDVFAVELGKAMLRSPEVKIVNNIEDMGKPAGTIDLENPGNVYMNIDMIKTQVGIALSTMVAFGLTGASANATANAVLPETQHSLAVITLVASLVSTFGTVLSLRHAKDIFNSHIALGYHEILHYLSTDFKNKRSGLLQYA